MAEGGRRAGAAAGPAADAADQGEQLGARGGDAAVRRRLRGKQSPPDGGLGAICDLAITAESRREIAWLAGDAQRQHVSYLSLCCQVRADRAILRARIFARPPW